MYTVWTTKYTAYISTKPNRLYLGWQTSPESGRKCLKKGFKAQPTLFLESLRVSIYRIIWYLPPTWMSRIKGLTRIDSALSS